MTDILDEGDKIFFMSWEQEGKHHFEIKDTDIRGKILKEGHGYPTKKEANKSMNKELKKLLKGY